MSIHLWGTDFRRSPTELRSRLYVPLEQRKNKLSGCVRLGFNDLLYLHTCNRVEFYTTANNHFEDTRSLWFKLLEQFDLPPESFYQGYYLEGKSALRHLVRVGASLESLVVGEAQILGQLKESARWTEQNALPLESPLKQCLQLTFKTAKEIRTETEIGKNSVSVATVALRQLQLLETQHPLESAVIVGRSPICLTILRWLLQKRPECRVLWVNRTEASLKEFTEFQSVEFCELKKFLSSPSSFTHLFTATSSAVPLFEESFFAKSPNAKVVVDLAHPADVSRSAIPKTTKLIQLEDLQAETSRNQALRQQALKQTDQIIENALKTYYMEQKEAPLLSQFNNVEPSFLTELEHAFQSIQSALPADKRDKIRTWAKNLIKKNLHLSREHLRQILREAAHSSPPTNRPL